MLPEEGRIVYTSLRDNREQLATMDESGADHRLLAIQPPAATGTAAAADEEPHAAP